MPKADAVPITAAKLDPFALGGFGDDAELLALFRQWIVLMREADRIAAQPDRDEAEYDRGLEQAWATENALFELPAAGVIGLSVKAYLTVFYDHSDDIRADSASLCAAKAEDIGFHEHRCAVSIMRDAARFVPEIAELARPLNEVTIQIEQPDGSRGIYRCEGGPV
jgi:hypothetical protein